jgi:asparagine synthase (glutamine-hydrolysing)
MTVRREGSRPEARRYWNVPFTPVPVGSEADVATELVERLREAVRIRLIAEVPLGAFLSGGVDSSAIVAMMAGEIPGPVNTCSITFPDPAYDEAPFAAQVAGRFGTDHQVQSVNPDDLSLVDRLVSLYDEPYADSSAMASPN